MPTPRAKSYVLNSTSGLTTVVAPPSGVVNGDRIYAVIASVNGTATITDPAGWTKVAEYVPGSTMKSAIYYHDVGATAEPATYTWTWSAAGRNLGYMIAYGDVDKTASPLAQPILAEDLTAMTTPAIVVGSGDHLVTFAIGRENPGTDAVKTWTNADPLDPKEYDLYSGNTGTSARITGAMWHSNRGLAAGSVQRSLTVSPQLGQAHAWSVQIPATSGGSGPVSGTNPWSGAGIPLR